MHTNAVTGGVINVFSGNAVEVGEAIQALLAKEILVIEANILGLIIFSICCLCLKAALFGNLSYK